MATNPKKSDRKGVPVRYAVVGLGHIAQVAVLPAFQHAENSELVAAFSDDPVKRAELSKRYGLEHVMPYESYESFLQRGLVDAVYIALPNHLHKDYTVAAARHGVHVLCEKPMAVTERECEQMIRACDDAHVRLMVAYRLHFDEANLQAVEMVQGGRIGEPRFFDSVFTQDVKAGDIRLSPISMGGGSVYDMGIYCLNAARYLFRAEPLEVSAFSVSREGDARFAHCDEMTAVTLRFPDDRVAQFVSSFGAEDVSHFRVVGTRGEVKMDPAYGYAVPLALDATLDGEREHRVFPKRDQFAPELLHFSECIQANLEPAPGGLEGLADVRYIEAIYASAATGRRVKVQPAEVTVRPRLSQAITRPGIEKPEEVHASGPSA